MGTGRNITCRNLRGFGIAAGLPTGDVAYLCGQVDADIASAFIDDWRDIQTGTDWLIRDGNIGAACRRTLAEDWHPIAKHNGGFFTILREDHWTADDLAF